MNLLKLFTKKPVVQESVYVVMLNYMQEYMSHQLALTSIKNIATLKGEYASLAEANLDNTVNAKAIKALIESHENYLKAQEFIEYCRSITKILPESFIVSQEQFNKVLKDYHLYFDSVKQYTGLIPPKQLKYLSRVAHIINNNMILIKSHINHDKYIIESIQVRDKDARHSDSVNWLNAHPVINIDWYDRFGLDLDDIIKCNPDCPEYPRTSAIRVQGRMATRTDLFIAAPKSSFQENYKIKDMPVDPIVFQYCPYGILVHAVWGEEADSEILKKYEDFIKQL